MNPELCDPDTDRTLPPSIKQIETRVQGQLSRRVPGFHLLWQDRGLVLRGHAPTYYAKQLAQEAVMRVSRLPILANEIEVS
jgi:hypothetical protein